MVVASSLGCTTPSPSRRSPPNTPTTTRAKTAVVTPLPVLSSSSSSSSSSSIPLSSHSTDLSLYLHGSSIPSSAHSTNAKLDSDEFHDIRVDAAELRPSKTLTTGQAFHWKVLPFFSPSAPSSPSKEEGASETKISAWGTHNAQQWLGVLRQPDGTSLVVVIRESPTTTLFRIIYHPQLDTESIDQVVSHVRAFLRSYFQLDTSPSLAELYETWSQACPRLARIATCIPGVRVIRQDPWECLISFLCSSNNNIPRITKMLAALRRNYGTALVHAPPSSGQDEEETESEMIYAFPSLDQLLQSATEEQLRNLGFGYRARYVMETAQTLQALGGEAYLQEHLAAESQTAEAVQDALLQFKGVGRKVADCIALFSLGQDRAIPVDVHVLDIAKRDYYEKPREDSSEDGPAETDVPAWQQAKSMTPTVYKQVGDLFRERFRINPGWAHSLLFVAELPSFRAVLPEDLVQEMDAFRQQQQEAKKTAAQTKKQKKSETQTTSLSSGGRKRRRL